MQALDRLAKLRAAMENLGIDAVIIPTADPHLSEYVPAHWGRCVPHSLASPEVPACCSYRPRMLH